MMGSSVLLWFKGVNWKNGRAGPKEAYVPTTIEHCANVITHGIWIFPSLLAVNHLLDRCRTPSQYLAAALYGTSLLLLFSVSTFFHSVFLYSQKGQLKDILHRCDRAVIYIFIAGSYFPWTMLLDYPEGSISWNACWLIWVLAFLGIIYQQLYHERFKLLETFFYCCIGIIPAIILFNQCENFYGSQQLVNGGILYLTGVVFFKADGRLPCAHAIWHLFVAAAAFVHYITISYFLFPDPAPELTTALKYISKVEL